MHESWEDIREEEQWAKINSDRNRSSYIEKDCFEHSQNYWSTGDRTAELNILLEDRLQKTVQRNASFKNPTSTVGLQFLNI
jgi:hypothetical protein